MLILIIFLISCKPFSPQDGGYSDSSPATVEDDIKLEIYKLKQAMAIKDKQVAALTKYDSLKTIYINLLNAQMSSLTNRFTRDSIYQWIAINKSLPITRFSKDSTTQWVEINKFNNQFSQRTSSGLLSSITSLKRDSVYQWIAINKVLPLVPLTNRFTRDSVYQWIAIKQLQGVAPVTQIPAMQAQIATILKGFVYLDKNFRVDIKGNVTLSDTIYVGKIIYNKGTDTLIVNPPH